MIERIGTASFGAMAIIVMVLAAQFEAPRQSSLQAPEPKASGRQELPQEAGDGCLPVAKQDASSSGREGTRNGCPAGHEADGPESTKSKP